VARLALGLGLLGSAFLLVIFPLGALSRATATDATALFYVSDAGAAAMQWLDAHARGAVVLAPPRYGTLLPGRAGVRVFYGHPFETVDAARRRAQAEAFFAGRLPDADWRQLRAGEGIEYVFASAADAGAIEGWWDDLEPLYRNGDTAIYRVRP